MKRLLPGCCALLLIAILALARVDSDGTAAQTSTGATPDASVPTPTLTTLGFADLRLALLAQADVDIPADGSMSVTVSTMTLNPGFATRPFVTQGMLVISVQAGSVQLDADEAEIGSPDIGSLIAVAPVTATPGPAAGLLLQRGQQAVLPPGTTATLSNPTDQGATLLLVSLAAAPAAASPAP